MSMIQVMTELEAVNEMLMSIGQAPVNTLNVTGIRDVNVARALLAKVSRRVQSRGWNFNTDDAYVLSPDVDDIILIPSGALKVIPQVGNQYTTRRHEKGLALYDRDNMTFKFAGAATVGPNPLHWDRFATWCAPSQSVMPAQADIHRPNCALPPGRRAASSPALPPPLARHGPQPALG